MAGTTGTRLLIENKSNKTITGYAISSERIWREHGKSGVAFRDWTGNVLLEPGESHSIDLPRSIEGGLLLRVQWVGFQDGSIWNNPRMTQ